MARVRPLENDVESFANTMISILDEDQRRLFLAAFSDYLGYGGATRLSEITGITQQTISSGRKELRSLKAGEYELPRTRKTESGSKRIRAEGGGRKSYAESGRSQATFRNRITWSDDLPFLVDKPLEEARSTEKYRTSFSVIRSRRDRSIFTGMA